MQDGMLDAADVLIDRQPVIDVFANECMLGVLRVDKSQEVPGRIDERVHGIGVSTGRLAACRAGGVHKSWDVSQSHLTNEFGLRQK